MVLTLCLVVYLCVRGVQSYSIFGGNTYGYTGHSWCSTFNGCMARAGENDEGRPVPEVAAAGKFEPRAKICLLYPADISNALSRPSLMQIEHYDADWKSMKSFFDKCIAGEAVTHTADCETIKGNEILKTRIEEIFQYQILTDHLGVLPNYQAAIWKWNYDAGTNDLGTSFNTASLCDTDCMSKLRLICLNVYHLRHVRDWCWTIVEWIDSDNLDNYQSHLLFMVYKYEAVQYQSKQLISWISAEEKAILFASAASTVFITKGLYSGIDAIPSLVKLPYLSIHSLLLATYVGRLRITLHNRPDGWNEGGVSVYGTPASIDSAKNFEGLTGSVYASLAALFSEKLKPEIKLRFRPEIHVQNSIGCIEQTTGMVFIRPGDWVPDEVEWQSIGPPGYNPEGIMALRKRNREKLETFNDMESTLEIGEGGLTMYPVTIGDLLDKKEVVECNSAKGNGKAPHNRNNLKGLGGICNWVPTW